MQVSIILDLYPMAKNIGYKGELHMLSREQRRRAQLNAISRAYSAKHEKEVDMAIRATNLEWLANRAEAKKAYTKLNFVYRVGTEAWERKITEVVEQMIKDYEALPDNTPEWKRNAYCEFFYNYSIELEDTHEAIKVKVAYIGENLRRTYCTISGRNVFYFNVKRGA